MIGRRSFALGMASLLAASRTRAEVMINETPMQEEPPKPKRRDVPYTPLDKIPNHRQLMRDIVLALAAYGKSRNPHFIVLARNAPELLVKEEREWKWETLRDPDHAEKYPKPGTVIRPYLKAIDGLLIDGPSFGAGAYGSASPARRSKALLEAGAAVRSEGKRLLAVDYCAGKEEVATAEATAAKAGALEFVDRDGDKLLGRIPAERPATENAKGIANLADARNYMPLLNSDAYGSRADWVAAVAATNYDLVVLDTFWRESESLTFQQTRTLRYKKLGADRLVLAVLPMALAKDTRFYWKPDWGPGNPPFLVAEDPEDPSETVVNYWDPKWKEIVGVYMKGLADLGVDGVLLDQLDAYLYFEDQMPLE